MVRNLPLRHNDLAFGALDQTGEAYVVFDPIDPTSNVGRRAISLGSKITLDHAQRMAADFNESGGWPFRATRSQLLVGREIPHLRKA